MADFREEEIIGKAYDAKLMRRLLEYAYPYWKILLVCVMLLLIVTGIELARPYLIKIAIDDHINALDKPMVAFQTNQFQQKGFVYNNKRYIRLDNLADQYPQEQKFQFFKAEGNYYLIEGIINEKEDSSIIDSNQYVQIHNGDNIYNAQLVGENLINKYREQDYYALSRIGLFFLTIIIIGFGINYLQIYLLNKTTQKIIYNMRQEIFSHLQKMSLSYFDKNPVGRLVTRVTNDTETLNEMYTNVLVNLFKDFFMLTGIMIVMISLNLQLALVSFSLIPVILLISVIFRKYIREVYRLTRVQLAKINSSLS